MFEVKIFNSEITISESFEDFFISLHCDFGSYNKSQNDELNAQVFNARLIFSEIGPEPLDDSQIEKLDGVFYDIVLFPCANQTFPVYKPNPKNLRYEFPRGRFNESTIRRIRAWLINPKFVELVEKWLNTWLNTTISTLNII